MVDDFRESFRISRTRVLSMLSPRQDYQFVSHPRDPEEDERRRPGMSKLDIEIPESLKRAFTAAALERGLSLDQRVTLAVAEKLSALRTVEYLREEGPAGRRENFERFLAAVPDREPAETDRLPD
jgi:hypothetical protein